MDSIYLDNSASTPLLPAVWEAMRPYCFEKAANPASSHHAGRFARQGLEDARERLASLLDAYPDEVLFTSGATESNNLAVFGLVPGTFQGAILASPIEHPSVWEPIQELIRNGHSLTLLHVANSGIVTWAGNEERPSPVLAVLQLANHETGAVHPVAHFARQLTDMCPVHCDAAAAAGKMPISFHDLGVASLTISAHKFHGPKGIGALLVRRSVKVRPSLFGGHQQHAKRPGTEAVPLAVGMAAALAIALESLERHRQQVWQLRSAFLEAIRAATPLVVNSPPDALPYLVNVSFPGCSAEILLMRLDLAGVACSTGSACSSGSLLPSPVLRAMGVSGEVLTSAMRFSFSAYTPLEEVREAAHRIISIVNELRQK